MNFEPNEMMMDLFRSEVESHSETLANSLLHLERDPADTDVLDSMMRAAHSIKGAARIVRVDAAVDLAHVMEDCFVAAQRGVLTIKPTDFDVLLRSVDLLVRVSEATKNSETEWNVLAADVQHCVSQLQSLRKGKPTANEPATAAVLPKPEPTAEHRLASFQLTAHSKSAPAKMVEPKVSTAPTVDNTVTLELGESFHVENAEEARQWLLKELHKGVSQICFDLSKTIDIDPVGLAFLAAARNYVEKNSDVNLNFAPVSPEMQLVLRIAGIALA